MSFVKRRVRVDMGYGPAEHWVTATAVDSRMIGQLFSEEKTEELLVEAPGGERIWTAYWNEVAVTKPVSI